jgi:hypothetical protein
VHFTIFFYLQVSVFFVFYNFDLITNLEGSKFYAKKSLVKINLSSLNFLDVSMKLHTAVIGRLCTFTCTFTIPPHIESIKKFSLELFSNMEAQRKVEANANAVILRKLPKLSE